MDDNGSNAKLKSLCNVAKSAWMLKYRMEKFSPHHINSILVKAWDDFNISSGNIIMDSFLKKRHPPLIPTNLTTNTQASATSTQVYSGAKAEVINNISRHTVASIELQITRTDNNMVVLREKGTQQSLRKIII